MSSSETSFNWSKKSTSEKPHDELSSSKEAQLADDPNVEINLDTDGNGIDININGTTLNATKNSCNITIGNFSITLKDKKKKDISTIADLLNVNVREVILPISYSAVISSLTKKPLQIVGGDDPSITANLSLNESVQENVHLLNVRSDGQNTHYLTANRNNFFVAVDGNHNLKVFQRNGEDDDDIEFDANFLQEDLMNEDNEFKLYMELDGSKHYLMVTDDGSLRMLPESEPGCCDDAQTKFIPIHS